MKSNIEFLSTPTADSAGTCLLLHFDNKRYIVGNAHEGLQRIMIQRGKKLNRITDIFLTGKTEWKNTGGLIGMILTLADSLHSAAAALKETARVAEEKKQLRQALSRDSLKERPEKQSQSHEQQSEPEKRTLVIHGGRNVTHTLATARRFVFRKGMPVDVNEIREDNRDGQWKPTWSDENIRVWAMSIEPSVLTTRVSISPTSSPSKRTYDQFVEETHNTKQERHDQQLRRGVITHMFDSDWRLDALFETPLAKVNMPAALFVRNPVTNKIETYAGPMPGGGEVLPDIKVLVRKPWPGALIAQLPPTKPSATALSYIIRNHPQRGKFDAKKAIRLGVPSGPLFRQLTLGIPVKSKDGTTVLPEQVLGPGRPGGGIAVVELPSDEYVPTLVARAEWRAQSVMEGVEAIIWILGPGVLYNQHLQKFMTEFSHMKHIISSHDCCPNYLSLDSAAAAAIRLYQIDSERYTVPTHDNATPPQLATNFDLWRPADRGLQIQLAPTVMIQDDTVVPPLNTEQVLLETPKDALFLAKAVKSEIASSSVQKEFDAQNLPSADSEINFLGTGSALPSKYRNVSATLLRVPGSGSYLFDCGENTLGQLSRMYTQEQLVEVLRDLKVIWISHMHADHHLGTTSVIKAWYKAVYGDGHEECNSLKASAADQLRDPEMFLTEQQRLFIASDDAMMRWLGEYASVEDFGYDKLILMGVWAAKPGRPDSTRMYWDGEPIGFNTTNPKLNQAMQQATGLTELAAANVVHCYGAKGVSVTFPTGFKFTYSGDCRPTRALTEIGLNSTVLLHEATFDDDLKGDAQTKLHSTTSEAIGIGIAMGARRILLTHFSQRYQKLPIMDMVDSYTPELEDGDNGAEGDPLVPVDLTAGRGAEGNPFIQTPIGEMVEEESPLYKLLTSAASVSNGGNIGGLDGVRIRKKDERSYRRLSDMKVGVAFDYMRVKVKDIALLERFTPALLKLYDHDKTGDSEGGVDETKGRDTKIETNERKVNRVREKTSGGGRVKQAEHEKESGGNGNDIFDDPETKLAASNAA
ncbi:hypothetical protein MMC30_006360 [Trapelia coarctata]|nr:hypothetical protein [Trapelia coarctata]